MGFFYSPRVEEGPPPLREEDAYDADTVSTADWTTVTGATAAGGRDDLPGKLVGNKLT